MIKSSSRYYLILPFLSVMMGCTSALKQKIDSEKSILNVSGAIRPYQRFHAPASGLTYYFREGASPTSPLVLVLQGSGCRSSFKKEDQVERFANKLLEVVDPVNPLVSILLIEKPYVETFQQIKENGTIGCSEEFKKYFTKEFWIKRIQATFEEVRRSYGLKPDRFIVVGHSEGAEIAAFLSSEMPEITHVLMGAGGGAVQLYEFTIFAANEAKGNSKKQTQAIQSTLSQWRQMNKDPMALEPLFSGHPPRYWTTFKKTSPGESLKKTGAKIYIMQGTDDSSTPVESADWLASELTAANKDFVYERIPGVDHAFKTEKENRFPEVWSRALQWALQ